MVLDSFCCTAIAAAHKLIGGIGIDGIINFFDEDAKGNKQPQAVAAQVKSGKVNSGQIRDLKGAVGGWYKSLTWGKKYRRLQILTIGDLFEARWKRGDVSEAGESQRDLI